MLHSYILRFRGRDCRRHIYEHFAGSLASLAAAGLADVVDSGVSRGRETVLLIIFVAVNRRSRGSRSGRRGDTGRLADDEDGSRAELAQEGVDGEVVGPEPGARRVPADDALAGWKRGSRVGGVKRERREVSLFEERRGVLRAIVGERKNANERNSPLTLRNIASIASAYEWSKNQIEGSRSSSSKGTEVSV